MFHYLSSLLAFKDLIESLDDFRTDTVSFIIGLQLVVYWCMSGRWRGEAGVNIIPSILVTSSIL
jgi:hypothetical protein